MRVISKRIVALSMGAVLVLSGVIGIIKPQVAHAASTFFVNSTLDTRDNSIGDTVCDDGNGNCTLRAAIEEANATGNPTDQDIINFALTGPADFANDGENGYTFSPASSYPQITQPVIIDGYTQIGSGHNSAVLGQTLDSRLLIQVSSQGATIFDVNADDVTIRGLVINGASTPGVGAGIIINGGNNTQIMGNFIGTDPYGLVAAPNFSGVTIQQSTNARIGSGNAQDINLISGNSPGGILIFAATGAQIQGNVVGPNANMDTTTGLSDDQGGIIFTAFQSGTDNMIGGPSNELRNIIAGSGGGIISIGGGVGTPVRNSFLGNSVYDISGVLLGSVGIDLVSDTNADAQPDVDFGANTNDAGDGDAGTNDYLNTPVIHSATNDPTIEQLFLTFDLDVAGSPADEYRVEFFVNDTNGTGQSKTFLTGYVTHAGLNQGYNFGTPSGFNPIGKYITATVTQMDGSFSNQSYGSTSEISAPVALNTGVLDSSISQELLNPNNIQVGGYADYRITYHNTGTVPLAQELDSDQSLVTYDFASPGLSYVGVVDDVMNCGVMSDEDAAQYVSLLLSHHPGYTFHACFYAGTPEIIQPGDSFSFVMRFAVTSIPPAGLTHFVLGFGGKGNESDLASISQIFPQSEGDTIDLMDEYLMGRIQGQNNVSLLSYQSTTSATNLAASGQPTVLAAISSVLLILPAAGMARRHQASFRRQG